MRCLIALVVLASAAPAAVAQQATTSTSTGNFNVAQVVPGMNGTRGGGISYVTRPTPTANAMATAQGFFAAGGVRVGGTVGANGAAVAGTAGASAGAAPGVLATAPKAPATVIPSDREMRILAAAANRGDAAAKARLSAIGQAMLARDEAQPAKR